MKKKEVNQINCQHWTKIKILHQEWEVCGPHRPSPKGSGEERNEKEQKAVHDGTSCSFEGERSQTDYPGHGEI